MRRLCAVTLLFLSGLFLSGCSYFQEQAYLIDENDVVEATTTQDSVEASTLPETAGLIAALRSRTDAVYGDPNWSPIIPQPMPEHYVAATGSLFDAEQLDDLYNDIKPRQLGDIVTVLLEENTQAQKKASSDTAKSSNLSLEPIEFGGKEITINEANLSYALSNDNQTSGSTSANQSNSLQGAITVEVVDVLANGNLVVRGEKWLRINTGDEYIRLSGTIRPDDIDQDNFIASTRISNVRIQYSGTGSRQDVQEENWLARFFNVLL